MFLLQGQINKSVPFFATYFPDDEDKMKKIITTIALIMFFLSTPALISAFQNEPDVFRKIKWGTEVNKVKDLQLYKKNDDIQIFTRKNEKLHIGNIPIKNILYYFYKNKFYKVLISYKDIESENLAKNLSSVYGIGKKEYIIDAREVERKDKASMSYYWYGKKVNIKLIRQTKKVSVNFDEPDCEGETVGSNQTIGPVTFFSCLSYTFKFIDKQKQNDHIERERGEDYQRIMEEKKKEQELRKKVEKDL